MTAVPPHERRTFLLVPVAADALVADFRRRHHAASVASGLPPHITVLFPFAHGVNVARDRGAELAAHFAAIEPFEATLTGVGRFDHFVWLAPEPRERFVDLLTATRNRFPGSAAPEDVSRAPEPHLTIAAVAQDESTESVVASARFEFQPLLPFHFTVDSVWLYESREDRTWQMSSRFQLG
ncbi:MAG: 2'-5' RNA ligase family protein [Thermoleophilia bacterium]|nr:2'-5' RNA ligase family protein [Thermoleophilia bacterium]